MEEAVGGGRRKVLEGVNSCERACDYHAALDEVAAIVLNTTISHRPSTLISEARNMPRSSSSSTSFLLFSISNVLVLKELNEQVWEPYMVQNDSSLYRA